MSQKASQAAKNEKNAKRQQEFRERKAKEGFVLFQRWVKPELSEQFEKMIEENGKSKA